MEKLCDCCKTFLSHHVINDRYLCCKCFIEEGHCPADWHVGCRKAYEEKTGVKIPDVGGLMKIDGKMRKTISGQIIDLCKKQFPDYFAYEREYNKLLYQNTRLKEQLIQSESQNYCKICGRILDDLLEAGQKVEFGLPPQGSAMWFTDDAGTDHQVEQEPKKTKVFLDLDGCLCNFFKGVCDEFEKPYDYFDLKVYDFWKPWGITKRQVNLYCDINFWSNLEWMHDGHEILDAVEKKFGSKNIYLLTTPMSNLGSGTGKMLWVRWNLPQYSERLIISTASKKLLAKEGCILIDDYDKNVDEFVEDGGQAILLPRPWNSLHGWADESLQILKNSLEKH